MFALNGLVLSLRTGEPSYLLSLRMEVRFGIAGERGESVRGLENKILLHKLIHYLHSQNMVLIELQIDILFCLL